MFSAMFLCSIGTDRSTYLWIIFNNISVANFCLFCTDINDCLGNQCQNGATCIDLIGAYSCQCSAGFEGDLCENGKFLFFCVCRELGSVYELLQYSEGCQDSEQYLTENNCLTVILIPFSSPSPLCPDLSLCNRVFFIP